MLLLEFMNMAPAGMFLILVIFLMPLILTIYCLFDIIRSNFKEANSKPLFCILVLLAPVVGPIIYLLLKKSFVLPGGNSDSKMPL